MDRLTDSFRTEEASVPGSATVPPEVDVLVVGYGPVGAAIANLLGRYGVRVLAVDKAKDIFMAPRAIALDNEALRILQLAGLEDGDFEKVAIPYVRMRSPLLGEFGRINTLGPIDGHPKLVTFYQPELEAALRRRAAQYGKVHTALGVALTGFVETSEGLVATLDVGNGRTSFVHARYLVGADGASSLVRQLIGQAFTGKTYAEDWLIVDAFGAQKSDRPCRVHLRSPATDSSHDRARRARALGVHAPAGRDAGGHGKRRSRERTAQALGRSCGHDDRTQGRLSLSRPHRQGLP